MKELFLSYLILQGHLSGNEACLFSLVLSDSSSSSGPRYTEIEKPSVVVVYGLPKDRNASSIQRNLEDRLSSNFAIKVKLGVIYPVTECRELQIQESGKCAALLIFDDRTGKFRFRFIICLYKKSKAAIMDDIIRVNTWMTSSHWNFYPKTVTVVNVHCITVQTYQLNICISSHFSL